jgi:hypothetical protein
LFNYTTYDILDSYDVDYLQFQAWALMYVLLARSVAVTPTMVRGWTEKRANASAAMADERMPSLTPYVPWERVVGATIRMYFLKSVPSPRSHPHWALY